MEGALFGEGVGWILLEERWMRVAVIGGGYAWKWA